MKQFRKNQNNIDMFVHNSLKYKNEFFYDRKKSVKMPILFKDAFLVKFAGTALTQKKENEKEINRHSSILFDLRTNNYDNIDEDEEDK